MNNNIWHQFYRKGKVIKRFGTHAYDYSKPDRDVVQLIKSLKRNNVKKILDLGCGEGRNSRYLAHQGFAVIGVDNSLTALRQAREKKRNEVTYKLADMRRLPFPANHFDAAISTQTIFHGRLKDIRKTLNEIIRVCKNNALIFITLQPVWGNKYRMGRELEPGTYISTAGEDKGEIHHFFNKDEIFQEFKNFRLLDIHLERELNYWYLLAANRK